MVLILQGKSTVVFPSILTIEWDVIIKILLDKLSLNCQDFDKSVLYNKLAFSKNENFLKIYFNFYEKAYSMIVSNFTHAIDNEREGRQLRDSYVFPPPALWRQFRPMTQET
jgi:hypothetical protein